MAVKFQGTHGLWVRQGGVWNELSPVNANSMVWDVLGGLNNKAWELYRITARNPIGPTCTWLKFLTTDKNGPGDRRPESATLDPSTFAGFPDLMKTWLKWVEHVDGGGFDLRVIFTNFNDSSFNSNTIYGPGRDGTTGFQISPAGHQGNSVQASLTYVDVNGFEGPARLSNTIVL